MKVNKFYRVLLIIFILALNIGCDQVSKSIVRKDIPDNKVIGYLGNHFTLEKAENTGAFLSLGDTLGGPLRDILLVGLPLIAVLGALVWIIVNTKITRWTLLGIILIIGGGVGNLYDRIFHGSVTDFMHIDFGFAQTGVFNVADMSIMTGMFMILIASYVKRKEEKVAEKKAIV